jgi:hypothetical protein
MRRLAAVCLVFGLLAGCSSFVRPEPSALATAVGTAAKGAIATVKSRRGGGGQAAAPKATTREDIEEFGVPIIRAVIATLGADILMTPNDTKGDIVTYTTSDAKTFTFRQGVLIQTRGLGPDLMSAEAPTVAQLLTNGGTHPRQYFFLGADDRTTRRSYDCTPTVVGKEVIEIFGTKHNVTKVSEECSRPQGSITNEFWIEGQTVRKSRQLVSGGIGFVEFEKVVD